MNSVAVRLLIPLALTLGAASSAHASISYVCDPNVNGTVAGTCNYLNTTIAGIYQTAFPGVNASIYIQFGTTALGASTTGPNNLVSYSTYLAALTGTATADAVDTGAIASLQGGEPGIYSGGDIEVTSALGTALGLSGMMGTTAMGASCNTPGSGGCYNGIITIITPAGLDANSGGTQSLYFRQSGGSIPADAYDYYSVVEHETDEVLGTSSCVDTQTSPFSDDCGGTNASAVDLFRYDHTGARVFIDATPGAYFSYNGGASNGAAGAIYNTLDNSDDYADFVSNCSFVQDATGCLGQSLDIGTAEINILDAVGFNTDQSPVPEPGTMGLLGVGLLGIGIAAYRRRA